MKSFLLIVSLLAASLLQAKPLVRIEVHVRGLEAEKMYLGFYFGDKTLLKDSALVSNGTAVFESDTLYPQGMYLVVLPPEQDFFDFFLDEDQVFSLVTDREDLIGAMEVNGSKVNGVFYNDIRFLKEQQDGISQVQASLEAETDAARREALQADIAARQAAVQEHRLTLMKEESDLFYSRFLMAVKGPDLPEPPEGADEYWQFFYFRAHYFDHLPLSDPAMLRTPIAHGKVMDFLGKYTAQDPDSLIESADRIIQLASQHPETFQYYLSTVFNHYVESKRMGAEPVMIHLAQTYYLQGKTPWVDSAYLAELRTYVRDRVGTLIGDKGKDFTILDRNEIPFQLYSLDTEWIVLYFWSYDCATCKKVTPQLASLMPAYLERGVRLVSVCTNGTREEWKEKLAEYGLPDIALADPSRQSGFDQKYHINSTPLLFVLDGDFTIRYKQIAVEDLGPILDFELGEK